MCIDALAEGPLAGRAAGEIWLCSGLLGAGEKTVLGGPFLRAFYTVLDRGRRAIGLAPSRNCSVPRQPPPPHDALLAAQARLRAAAKAAPALLLAPGAELIVNGCDSKSESAGTLSMMYWPAACANGADSMRGSRLARASE